jgi:lincosamide nucleotidyltransferase A/C/D/E
MTDIDVLEIISLLEKAGITVWLDGGWAIDAIVKRQTRKHDDLDVVVELSNVNRVKKALAGFIVLEDELPTRFVLGDAVGRRIDFHTVTFNSEGGGVQQLQNGTSYTYPAHGFLGIGEISGKQIPCLTAEVQAECHYGYEPDENDRHDMKLLHDTFGIKLKPPYI